MNGHKIINQNELHFLTFTIVGWVDVFTRDDYKKIIVDSFKYCQKEKGLELFAYVIMSNHIHIIARTENKYGLSSIIRDFKKFTSKKIIKSILENPKESRSEWMLRLFKYYAKFNKRNKLYQFWKQDNHPIEIISKKWANQKLNYIHNNPVRAGWVDLSREYIYSSARNYQGENGVLDIKILEIGLWEDR